MTDSNRRRRRRWRLSSRLRPMPLAAIYVKDSPTPHHGLISKEDQETACREYCSARQLTVTAVYADPAGTRDQFERLMAVATSADASFDAIVVWKTSRFAVSLEDTIMYRDQLRHAGARLLSVMERNVND